MNPLALLLLVPALAAAEPRTRIEPRGGGGSDSSSDERPSSAPPRAPAGESAPPAAGRTRIERRPAPPAGSAPQGPPGASPPGAAPSAGPAAGPRVRIVPGQATQSSWRGTNYWVYQDPYGPYWHGYYAGPHFYWTRWHRGHWWWHHPYHDHWYYWDDDGWRRPPATETAPPPAAAPPVPAGAAPPAAPVGGEWWSPDRKRLVQVAGPGADAFLYDADASTQTPRFVGRLGGGVEKVRFSGGADGKPLRILIDQKDGKFLLFDRDGKPLDP